MITESVYLRLAAPLQSWAGGAITGNIVHTQPYPTRTGLIGLVAGALGYVRGALPHWLDKLDFLVRVDAPGQFVDEFQTINPRDSEERFRERLRLALGLKGRGKKALAYTPDAQDGTSIVNRTYLADAEFIVQVTSAENPELLADALRKPIFDTYLGRKAFAPTFPFYLGRGDSDLLSRLPVHRRPIPSWDRRPVSAQVAQVDAAMGDTSDEGKPRVASVPVKVIPRSASGELVPYLQEFPVAASRQAWLKEISSVLSV